MPLNWIAGPLLAAGLAASGSPISTVATGGSGVLTKCRNWIIAHTCRTYHHIRIPRRIAVGEAIRLSVGSNPKHYDFPVARISLGRGRCTVFSEPDGNPETIDRIDISPCTALPKPL